MKVLAHTLKPSSPAPSSIGGYAPPNQTFANQKAEKSNPYESRHRSCKQAIRTPDTNFLLNFFYFSPCGRRWIAT
jgi:hypothetical protein